MRLADACSNYNGLHGGGACVQRQLIRRLDLYAVTLNTELADPADAGDMSVVTTFLQYGRQLQFKAGTQNNERKRVRIPF